MIAAYGLAMTLIPAYFVVFAQGSGPAAEIEGGSGARWSAAFARKFDLLRERYESRLRWVLARKRPTLLAAGIGFAVAVALYPALGTELFPPIDAGQFTVRLRAASGTRIELSETLAANVESAVRAAIPHGEIKTIVTNTGVLYDWPAAYTPNAGPMDTFLNVQLVADHHRSAQEYVRSLRDALSRQFPDVSFDFDTGGLLSAALNNGAPAPIDIQITGNNLRTAHEWAERVAALARGVRGAVDVRIQQKLDYPSLEVHVDRVKAAYLGLTVEAAVKNIVTALNSSTSFLPGFWIDQTNGNHYFLGAQYPEALLSDKAALENIPLTDPGSSGETVHTPTLLRNIATVAEGTSALEVEHRNIQRVTDVYVNVDRRDIGSVAADIEKRIATLTLPTGYKVSVGGEVQSMRESFAGLRFGLLMAVALVYLLLAAQFRSFLDPLIVLITVPLGIIGVIAALLLTGTTLNIESYIGTIFMVGIAASNSVVLVEFANRLRAQDVTPVEAMVSACGTRLRPILMTALAAVAALSPMAFHFGTGAEANVPLARAVIGGLTASTVLTLFLVPALYLTVTANRGRGAAAGEIS
jgi:multidrug efflux pump subunit AcrB